MKFRNVKPERSDILGLRGASPKREIGKTDIDKWRQGLGYLSMFAGVATILSSQAAGVSAKDEAKSAPAVPDRVARLAQKIAASCSKPELLRRQSNYRLPGQKGQFNMFEVLAGTDNCPGSAIPFGTYTAAAPFTDTGSTTGANSTVTFVQEAPGCIQGANVPFYDQAAGPDHIYSFTLTARGASPEIRVTPGNGTYDPSIYILSSSGTACPAGTQNDVTNCLVGNDSNPVFSGGVEIINAAKVNSLPLNQQLFLFIDGFYPSTNATSNGPYTVRIQDVTVGGGPTPPSNDAPLDMNADGKTDFVMLRNVGGGTSGQIRWYTAFQDGDPTQPTDWGIASDQFFVEDYDLDGQDDFGVFRPSTGTFYIVRSATDTMFIEQFGQNGDDATVAGDYSGDGRADLAVYRSGATAADQSFWYWKEIGIGGFQTISWGQGGDFPAPGDYDGDNRNDYVVQRADGNGVNGRFWKRLSTAGITTEMFGLRNDTIAPGDYDDDGKTDLAVVRDNGGFLQWDFEPSGTAGTTTVSDTWGVSATDFITQGDYDGDGRTEYAIWRPGTGGNPGRFYTMTVGPVRTIRLSLPWGEANDRPAAEFNVH